MKTRLMGIFAGLLFGGVLGAEEEEVKDKGKVYPHDVGYDIDATQKAILDAFPTLRSRCLLFNGHCSVMVFEDQERPRILLSYLPDAFEILSMVSEDQDVQPMGEAKVKVAGMLSTADGTVDYPEGARDQMVGYWVSLKRTEDLEISGRMIGFRSTSDFEVRYDPDRFWRGAIQRPELENKEVETADAYEISLDSLVERVKEVLGEKESCRVKFARGRGELELRRWNKELLKGEIQPMFVSLGEELSINRGPAREVLTVPGLHQRLEMYCSAARAAEAVPMVRFRLREGCADEVFREVLHAFEREGPERIYVEVIKEE